MSQIHHMTLNDPWFNYVKDGTKIYEGRCNKKSYVIDDQIIFAHHTDKTQQTFTKTVVEILYFKSFEEALTMLPISQILPNINTVSDGVDIYKKFVSLETQNKCGVIMIKLT